MRILIVVGIAALAACSAEPVTKSVAVARDSIPANADLAPQIPKNFRATPVRFDRATLEMLRPGQFIDLLGVFEVDEPHGVTLIQNVPILGIDGESAVLMLTPDEAQKVYLAGHAGWLSATIRSEHEGNTQVPLEKANVKGALGIREKPRVRPKASYRQVGDLPFTPDNYGINHDGVSR